MEELAKRLAQPERMGRRSLLSRLALVFAGAGAGVAATSVPSFAATGGACPPGLKLCGTRCRVTTIDPDHCGTCGTKCASNEVCRNGKCRTLTTDPTCPGSTTWCGACVDMSSDAGNCGSCGNACGAGDVCVSGTCQAAPECTSKSDCPSDTECVTYTCNQGLCGASFTVAGTPVAQQIAGDCQVNVCDGSGAVTQHNDDADVPAASECNVGLCSAGTPTVAPVTDGTPCTNGVCQAGTCVA